MPDIAWNKVKWGQFGWKLKGDEWSADYGSAVIQWFTSIFPRLHYLLPVQNILEIAPGFGRWTNFLLPHCEKLVAYDLNDVCTNGCTQRFKAEVGEGRCEFYTNDGLTFPQTADGTIDLVFSFDSLVHVENDVIESYLKETARVLRPGGHAFLHHSNLADKKDEHKDGTLGRGMTVGGSTVTAAARQAGLVPLVQERISWQSQGLRDCITVLAKQSSAVELKSIENTGYWPAAHEARSVVGVWEQALRGSPEAPQAKQTAP